jgi:hypothetical protein
MRKIVWISLCLVLSSCTTAPAPLDASSDVRAFVMALRDRNLPGIEARIDRPALQAQVTGIARAIAANEIAKRTGGGEGGQILGVLGADLANPLLERLSKQALGPAILADLARRAGLTPETVLPSRPATSMGLKRLTDGRVCAPDPQTKACILYFGRYPSGWKLNALDEAALRGRLVAPAAPRAKR